MKKFFLVLVSLVFLFSVSLFATTNSQKYYPVSSIEWRSVNELCHYVGVAGPTSNGPVTKAQLLLALERAEEYLDSDNPILLDIKNKLNEEYSFYSDSLGSISLVGVLSPELYGQTNGNSEAPMWGLDSSWAIKNHLERKSAAVLTLENTIRDSLYSRFAFEYRQKVGNDKNIWTKNFHTSFYGTRIAQNFPYDAGVSLGTKGLSLILGRGHVSLGEGYTGNTAIGDNYDYQEFMKTGFYTKNTSVFVTLTSFDSSHASTKLVEKTEDGKTYYVPEVENLSPWDVKTSQFSGYKNVRHSAGYDIVLFDKHKVSLAFVTLLDTDTAFDFRYLNPFMVLHNMYNYHEGHSLEANNMISIDYSVSVAPRWNIYLQLTMDQLQIKGETDGYINSLDYTDPNAFGGLFNLSYTDIFCSDTIVNLYGEVVYNMPGMYLNSKFYNSNGEVTQLKTDKRCWSQDYLLGYSREEENGYDDVAYSGYIYGPDCVVVSLGGTMRRPNSYSLSSSIMYMAHGAKGRGESASNYTFDEIDKREDVNRVALTGTVEHSLIYKAEAELQLRDYLSFSFGGAYQYRWNYMNTANKNYSNLQLFVGLKLSTISFTV